MIKAARYEEDFYKMYEREKRKIVVYGAGNALQKEFEKIPEIFLICDKKAKSIGKLYDIPVYEPSKLQSLHEEIYIIICVYDTEVYKEIYNELQKFDIDAIVFHIANNVAFGYSFWETEKSYQVINKPTTLKINIVCANRSWIFRKFADRMYDVLSKYDIDVLISSDTRDDVDINHHIPYIAYKPYPNDTLMITHVDNVKKLALLKKQLDVAGMGICMSNQTMERLVAYGVKREKICYINPAHDNVIRPRKYVIGITYKCRDEEDVRKRASAITDILDGLDSQYFKFFVMGSGWDKIVQTIRGKGFEIEYYPEFVYDTYNTLMQTMDYFLYMGFDEGAMGYLDALAVGAGTIVTPQGYHLDTGFPIDYPCNTIKEFKEAFLDLQRKKEKRVEAVSDWTWENYTLKHLELWNYLLRRIDLKKLFKNQSFYMDGIFSALIEDNRM